MRISKRARTARGRLAIVASLAVLSGLLLVQSAQADLYYGGGASAHYVARTGLDGTNPVPTPTPTGSGPIDVTSAYVINGTVVYGNHLYYARSAVFNAPSVGRVTLNPDGTPDPATAVHDFISPITGGPIGIGMEPDGSALYIAHTSAGTVTRVPLDSAGNVDGPINANFMTGLVGPRDVESDGKYIYVSMANGGKIVRATLAGAPYEVFVSGVTNPAGMAVTRDSLYWVEERSGARVGRLKLDPVTRDPVGASNPNFITGLTNSPGGLASDGLYLYLLDDNGSTTNMRRAQLTAEGDFVPGSLTPNTLALTSGLPRGIAVAHDVSSTISCDPSPVVLGGDSTCTASVADIDTGAPLSVPGTVHFSNVGAGDLSADSCELSPTDTPGLSQCSVTYMPTGTVDASDIISTTYAGGLGINKPPAATLNINSFLRHSSSTATSCTPASLTIEHAVECTATVTDTATAPALGIQPPHGTVSFHPSASGDFAPAPECDLVPIDMDPDSSSCSVTFESTQIGGQSVRADYAGQPQHYGSDGASNAFTILGRTTNVAVSCSPVVVTAGTPSVCEASVADTDIEEPHLPQGTVTFSSPGGTFSPSSCTLSPSGGGESACAGVTFTPSAAGMQPVTASYGGDHFHAGDFDVRGVRVKPGPNSGPTVPQEKSGKSKCKKKKSKKARKKCRKKH